jgi:hypothetical protein
MLCSRMQCDQTFCKKMRPIFLKYRPKCSRKFQLECEKICQSDTCLQRRNLKRNSATRAPCRHRLLRVSPEISMGKKGNVEKRTKKIVSMSNKLEQGETRFETGRCDQVGPAARVTRCFFEKTSQFLSEFNLI